MDAKRWTAVLALVMLPWTAQAQTNGKEQVQAGPLPAPYGPVLTRRPPGVVLNSEPAAVPGDLAGQAPPALNIDQSTSTGQGTRPRTAQRRHPAVQGEGPMAPRPLRPHDGTAVTGLVPVPPPTAAPQPVVPSSTLSGSCQGGLCSDAAGNTINSGGGAAGVSDSGRLCVRGTGTIQCF